MIQHPIPTYESATPPIQPLFSPEHEDVPIWNILPSYQLYQSTFSKNLSLSNDDLTFEPPGYDDSDSPPDGLSPPPPPPPPTSGLESLTVSDGYFTGCSLPEQNNGLPPLHAPVPESIVAQVAHVGVPVQQLAPMSTSPPYMERPPPFANGRRTPVVVEQTPTRWENSIQGNSHKLKRLKDTDSQVPSSLAISIQLTRKPCEAGKKPELIDPKQVEFQQGDTINGYITVTNESSVPIPFSMFFVVFEGKISVRKPGGGDINDPKFTLIFYKFLNQFDYNASWTPANIDSSTNEVYVDPIDNACLRLSQDRIFEPKETYKKFFSFKIPVKLLDCACEIHNLPLHCEALPSIGLPRDQFLLEVRKLRKGTSTTSSSGSVTPHENGHGHGHNHNHGHGNGNSSGGHGNTFGMGALGGGIGSIGSAMHKDGLDVIMKNSLKDLSFPDTAISYSIEARVVGKASDHSKAFKLKDPKREDEFVVVNEASSFVRIVPHERIRKDIDRKQIRKESEMVYKDLVTRVEEVLEMLHDLDAGRVNSPILRNPASAQSAKRPQLYSSKSSEERLRKHLISNTYEVSTPCYKKTLSTAAKYIGDFVIQTPKVEYITPYRTPQRYKRFGSTAPPTVSASSGINIPLTFTYKGNGKSKPPEIKSYSVDLIVFTYRSKKYPLPIELYYDLIFQNKKSKPSPSSTPSLVSPAAVIPADNFDVYVVQPFQKYLEQITQYSKVWGWESLNISKQLIMDIKSLAHLQPKCNTIKIEHTKLSGMKWSSLGTTEAGARNAGSGAGELYTSQNNIAIDLKNLKGEKGEECCLVPSFQSCIMGRLYYLRITISIQHSEPLVIKVPLSIEK